MKDVIYFVQRYRPELEATSKEIACLQENISNSAIHDLHLDKFFKMKFKKRYYSYHFIWYPAAYLALLLLTSNKIIHNYTGIPDSIYLPTLPKKKMVITATNYFSEQEITKKMPYLKNVKAIIVQSEIQKEVLISQGMPEKKIKFILPPVNLQKFKYQKANGDFKILNASCPTKTIDLEKRGIHLLFESVASEKDIMLKLLWRKGWEEAEKIIKEKHSLEKALSIVISTGIVENMNLEYGNAHCTIIPYLRKDPYLKVVPLSIIESLAAGKPVLVSSETGISPLIEKEQCGIVFRPNKESLLKAIRKLKNSYSEYQKNCRKTAEKYFSQEQFIKEHQKIYSSLQ